LWTDTQIKGIIPDGIDYGTHTVVVEREVSGGVAASTAAVFDVGGTGGLLGVQSSKRSADAAALSASAELPVLPESGGAVEAGNRARVSIPAGALDEETTVAIYQPELEVLEKTEMSASQDGLNIAPVGSVVEFSPDGLRFSSDVLISVPYQSSQLPAGKTVKDIRVFHWDRLLRQWIELETIADGAVNRVSAYVRHFSIYQAMATGVYRLSADSAFRLGDVYAFPNPAKRANPTIHAELGQADSVMLRIYDISGQQAHEADITSYLTTVGGTYAYEYTWDVSGKASGVYLYVIRAKKAGFSDITVKSKLAVIK
jgi:hypothetical protein